jgi:hypothetical protein
MITEVETNGVGARRPTQRGLDPRRTLRAGTLADVRKRYVNIV